MKYRFAIYSLGLLMWAFPSCTQEGTPFKIGFETIEGNTKLPRSWFIPDQQSNYNIYADSLHAFSGKRSLLLESKKHPDQTGMAMVHIPVDFNGSKVTLSGFIKTENIKNGNAGMLIRIEGDEGWMMMDNMRSGNVAGTADWKRYEISLPLNRGARDIYIGAYNSGTGKVWVDDLEMLVDGKTPGAGERITLPPALKDTAFLNGSRVVIDSLSPGSLHDLAVLAKVWGFLKYYHPAVAAGQHNWDAELFRMLPKILAANSKPDRNDIMLNWVKSLGNRSANKKPAITDTVKAKLQPDLDWLADKQELGDPLSEELKSVSHFSWNADHFYVKQENTGKPIFMNESGYNFIPFSDDGYRLLALYRYWNIIQYYYPYRHLIGENWTNILTRFIPQFIHADSPEKYQLAVLKMIASIHDSHGNLTGRIGESGRFMGSYGIPADVRFIEGKATVINMLQRAGDQADGLLKGDVILKVNGKTVKEIQDRLDPFISASTASRKLDGMAYKILRGNDSAFFMEVEREGRTVALKVYSHSGGYIYPRQQPISWKFLPGDIGYVFSGTLRNDDIPLMMSKFRLSARAIIIDLRSYPFQHVADGLCSYLSDRKVEFIKPYFASIQRPGLFYLRPTLKVGGGAGNNPLYKEKVVLLVNEFTESRGEYITMALKAMPNVTIIGSNTAGTDGDVSDFSLPGGLKTRISGVGYCWPDGTEVQRIGIIPDIIVQPTLKGIRGGKDEVLDAALSYLKK